MNATQLVEALQTVVSSGLVPFITSSPGCGKSSIVAKLAKDNDLVLIDLRLSMLEPSDLNGLPSFNDQGQAYFAPFNIFPLENTKLPKGKEGFILFLDEFNSASKQVMAACYKLILDRTVGNHKLHPNVIIVCAGNRLSDRAIVNQLSTAMQSRLLHINLDVTYEDWLDYALDSNFDNRITSYLSQYPNKLNTFNPENTVVTYCCPRTWEFVNKLIKDREITPLLAECLRGTIDEGVAIEFVQYTKVFDQLPSIKSIEQSPETAILPTDTASRWAIMSLLVESVTSKNITAIMTYSERFSLDLRIYLLKVISKRNPKMLSEPSLIRNLTELSRYLSN